MKKLWCLLSLPMLAGCLTAADPEVSLWPLEYQADGALPAATPQYGITRMAAVIVRAPYGERNLAVLRANGSIAFDNYHEFAAAPAALLKGVVADAMRASGRFQAVVGASSIVKTENEVEVAVRKLALDCRQPGSRQAVVELVLRLEAAGRPALHVTGASTVDAADGRYGAAFSKAISAALGEAIGKLP